jgi:hypothetical protein
MNVTEILTLPLVKTYTLSAEPNTFFDLLELCKEVLKHKFTTQLYFPVGIDYADEHGGCFQPYQEMTPIQESPIVFSVSDGNVTDYGVVDGTSLDVYRQSL